MYYVYYTYKKDEPSKAYIGMTKQPRSTNYKGSGIKIKNALKRYSNHMFNRIDLGVYNDKEECHYWEGFYIKQYKTENRYGGYNISPTGGFGHIGCHSDDTKAQLSKSHLGAKNAFYGQSHSDFTKKKIAEKVNSQVQGINNPMYGKKAWNRGVELSDETKRKISESNRIALKGIRLSAEHKEKLRRKVQCPHCNKVGGIAIMKRWHFDNCKNKSKI